MAREIVAREIVKREIVKKELGFKASGRTEKLARVRQSGTQRGAAGRGDTFLGGALLILVLTGLSLFLAWAQDSPPTAPEDEVPDEAPYETPMEAPMEAPQESQIPPQKQLKSKPAQGESRARRDANALTADSANAVDSEEAPQSSQGLWYRSNQLGMALEQLDDPRDISLQEWGLEVERTTQQRLKTLYYRGQPRDTWVLTYRKGKAFQEQHKRNGVLLENRFFDEETGYLAEIGTYSVASGELRERELFFYNQSGHLLRSMLYDESGQLARETTFRLDGSGQLVKLKVHMNTKKYDLVQYQLPGLDTFIRNDKQNHKYLVRLFDSQRRNTSQIVYNNNVIAKRTNFEYAANGTLLREIVTEDRKATQYDYNSAGLLLQKQIWSEDILSETEIYKYDRLGRLGVQKVNLWTENSSTEERYTYLKQTKDLQKIEFFIDDKLDKIRTYTSGHAYYEELYIHEKPVAKVYYNYDDQLHTEVTFQNVSKPENYNKFFAITKE